jgi:N-acyl homoserine lactone hydrolase
MLIRTITLSLILTACVQQEDSVSIPAMASESAVAKSSETRIKLYTFDCGTIEVSDFDVFSSSGDYAGQAGILASTCYLIRHPLGDLIWDLGLPLATVGEAPQTNGVFTLSQERSLADQLAVLEMTPADIEFIAISHSHFDHTGQVALFPDAQWLVNDNEFEHMFSTDESKNQNLAFADLDAITYSGNHDVFGDGSVTVLAMPGHTPGHSALQINLTQAGTILLTGDLYHRQESRDLQRVPRFNTDEVQTRESMATFETLASVTGARVIIQHEKADIIDLPKPPEFLH